MGDFEMLQEVNLNEINKAPRTARGGEISEYYKFLVHGFIEFCQNKSAEFKGVKLSQISGFTNLRKEVNFTITKETLNLGKPKFSSQFIYSEDYKPLLKKLIDTKKAHQAAQLSTNTATKKITRKFRALAASAGFITEGEMTLEEKLYNHIFFKFFENDKELLKSTTNKDNLKYNLILYFKEVISLGIVSSEKVLNQVKN